MNQNLHVSINVSGAGLREELERIIRDASGFRVQQRPEDKARPDLLIYELGADPDEDFQRIRSLLESNAVSEVFVTSDQKEADLLLKAMRAGAKEFIPQPLDEKEMHAALASFRKRMSQTAAMAPPAHAGRIINVIGAKGGVGTTTVAVNLAMTLADKKQAGSVALVDLNTIFGEIPLFLSLTPIYHWGQIVKDVDRIDSTFLLNTMARHPSGVHVLPSPSYLNGHPPATSEVMNRLLTTMRMTFDFIIVDGGQSLDGSALRAIEMADRIFLITLLNLPCLRNTQNLLKSLASMGLSHGDRISLVVNRYLKKSDITLKEAEESVKADILWSIPNDYKTTMSAINRGKPLNEISPKAEITRKISELADSLLPGYSQLERRGGFLTKLLGGGDK